MNFVIRVLNDIIWYIAQIITFEVIFRHTTMIGDWNVEQTRVFLGVLFVVDGLYMLFIHENIETLPEKVSRGDLDLLLLKPVNSQFIISCQRFVTPALANLAMGIGWLTWALMSVPDCSWMGFIVFIWMIPSSLFVIYSMRFLFATTSVILTKSENIQYLWFSLYRLGTRPDTIFTNPWRMVILTIIPMGVVASVPSRLLFNQVSWPIVLWSFCVGPLLLYTSSIFWKYCLTKYQSASS
ncbi:MAG: ABC transporter permease [Pseudobdellovibrionaceae bacterium]